MDDDDSQRSEPDLTSAACTAVLAPGEAPPNPLFTPPCTCPRCAPTHSYAARTADDGWLRISGHPHRYRVEPIELGAVGRDVLG